MVLVAAATLLGGCDGGTAVRVNLPPTPVISVRPRWAVAVTAYTRIRAEPAGDADIRGHLRAGDVAEIVSISTTPDLVDGRREYWYELSSSGLQGWALGADLRLYESRNRALNSASAVSGLSGDRDGDPSAGGGGEP